MLGSEAAMPPGRAPGGLSWARRVGDPECCMRCRRSLVAVKSVVHFRAAYEPLASLVVEVDGPGISSLDLSQFEFKNIPRPIFPLDPI